MQPVKRNRIGRRLLAALVVAGLAQGGGARALAARPAETPALTLSVYTCCGSLAGFNDANAADLGSMRASYGPLWARMNPPIRWRESSFDDQATMIRRLARAVAAGTPPDLVFIQGDYAGYVALRRLAQPLDAYYARARAGAGAFLPGMARWAHFGGHWWAIPAVSGPMGGQQIYLPAHMRALGFDNATLRTFDDYYRMSRRAVQFDAAVTLRRIGYWPGVDSWETIGTLMCAPGHGLFDAANRPTATDPCNLAYLRFLKQLADLYGGYATLRTFLAGDPDFLGGNPRAFMVSGKALITPSGYAFWNTPPFDSFNFGQKDGVSYQLTPLPPTRDGAMAEAASYPSTMQEAIIPPGARHPDAAFAVSALMFWDHGYLLGRSTSGSPVVRDQGKWLATVIATEAAVRAQAGLPGNPIAGLEGLRLQPQLGMLSRASSPLNPAAITYHQQLVAATERVLLGRQAADAALAQVQAGAVAEEQQLRAQYGPWSW